jgi:bacterioferritin-associated ferredoxin
MCFSATASFATAGALSAVGAVTLKETKKHSSIPFASIPLLFGIQQGIEGIVWLTFGYPMIHTMATYAYSFFSHILWPAYVPFAVYLIEKDPKRKKLIALLLLLGLAVGLYILFFIATKGITSEVINSCIAYHSPHLYQRLTLALYVAAACGSCLVSSHRVINIFGLVMIAALFISAWFFIANFVSVWCFFAAILSAIVYWQVRPQKKVAKRKK